MAWFHQYPKPQHAFYPDRVLPAVTGGFGEVSCHSCHFDGEVNTTAGRLELLGLSSDIIQGETYELEVQLSHPQLRKAGFQLSSRSQDGSQHGHFISVDSMTVVQSGPDGLIQYMNHSEQGSDGFKGKASWKFRWTAGKKPGEVVIHLAANAANGDDSEFGDNIYLKEWRLRVED
jgi:hypothetical protein